MAESNRQTGRGFVVLHNIVHRGLFSNTFYVSDSRFSDYVGLFQHSYKNKIDFKTGWGEKCLPLLVGRSHNIVPHLIVVINIDILIWGQLKQHTFWLDCFSNFHYSNLSPVN